MEEESKNDINLKGSNLALGGEQIKNLCLDQDPLVCEQDFINKFRENAKKIIKHLLETPQDNNPFYLRIFYIESMDGIYHLIKCTMQPCQL